MNVYEYVFMYVVCISGDGVFIHSFFLPIIVLWLVCYEQWFHGSCVIGVIYISQFGPLSMVKNCVNLCACVFYLVDLCPLVVVVCSHACMLDVEHTNLTSLPQELACRASDR